MSNEQIRLEEQCKKLRLRYAWMEAGNDARFLILERGGRIFGPFFGDEEGTLWMSGEWKDTERMRLLLEKTEWNVGGDRVWIGPEIDYHIHNRANPEESMHIPKGVDPGHYRLKSGKRGCTLKLRARLRSYHHMTGVIQLQLKKTIMPAANPLRELPDFAALMDGVDYAGYTQELRLQKRGKPAAEAWNITQIKTPALILIPASSELAFADYYEPVDKTILTVRDGAVRLLASGARRYKIGLKAAHTRGDIVSIQEGDGVSALIIKRFFNNPSASYAEEPAAHPGEKGMSIHVYNDDGALGGFAELECNLTPAPAGRSVAAGEVVNWFFRGEKQRLNRIAEILTGVKP